MEYAEDGDEVDSLADYVLFMFAPSPFYAQATGTDRMAPDDEKVPMAEIDLDTLEYWDESQPEKGWQRFVWDSGR